MEDRSEGASSSSSKAVMGATKAGVKRIVGYSGLAAVQPAAGAAGADDVPVSLRLARARVDLDLNS